MWSMQPTGEAASGSRLTDHRPDYTRVNRNIEWRTVSHKHGTALCRRASFVKIAGNGMPGDGRQRQDVDAVGLAHPDSQRGVLPIDVFQAQRRNLKGAEPEIHQAANDRVIALTLRISVLKGGHKSGEFLLAEVLRQRSQPPTRRLGNRRYERLNRICMPQSAKPQITPNGGCHDLCAARLIALALRGEEVPDGFRPQPRELKNTGGKDASEEPANPLAS